MSRDKIKLLGVLKHAHLTPDCDLPFGHRWMYLTKGKSLRLMGKIVNARERSQTLRAVNEGARARIGCQKHILGQIRGCSCYVGVAEQLDSDPGVIVKPRSSSSRLRSPASSTYCTV